MFREADRVLLVTEQLIEASQLAQTTTHAPRLLRVAEGERHFVQVGIGPPIYRSFSQCEEFGLTPGSGGETRGPRFFYDRVQRISPLKCFEGVRSVILIRSLAPNTVRESPSIHVALLTALDS